jgi:hypothetical protein
MTTTISTRKKKLTLDDIEHLTLLRGSHETRARGLCVMEAVAWFAGEKHADRPQCACPVLTSFAIKLNDRIYDDEERTRIMRPLIPRLVNTRGTRELEVRRAYVAADFAARDCAPRALDSAASVLERRGKTEHATKLRGFATQLRELPAVVDKATGDAAAKVAREARADAAAYADAAYAAADAAAAAYAADDAAAAASAADAAAAAYAAYAAAAAAAAYAADAAADAAAAYAADAAKSARVAGWEAAASCLERMIECS